MLKVNTNTELLRDGYLARIKVVGNQVFVSDGSRVIVLSPSLLSVVREFEADHWIRALDVSSDGSIVAAGGYAKHVLVWDVESGIEIGRLEMPYVGLGPRIHNVAISPDNRLVAAVGGNTCRVLDLQTNMVSEIEPYAPSKESLTSVSFSPEGCLLVVSKLQKADKDWEILVLDPEDWKIVSRCSGRGTHERFVGPFYWSPDNSQFVLLSSGQAQFFNWDGSKITRPTSLAWTDDCGSSINGFAWHPESLGCFAIAYKDSVRLMQPSQRPELHVIQDQMLQPGAWAVAYMGSDLVVVRKDDVSIWRRGIEVYLVDHYDDEVIIVEPDAYTKLHWAGYQFRKMSEFDRQQFDCNVELESTDVLLRAAAKYISSGATGTMRFSLESILVEVE
jgi:WD40 repeat protein